MDESGYGNKGELKLGWARMSVGGSRENLVRRQRTNRKIKDSSRVEGIG